MPFTETTEDEDDDLGAGLTFRHLMDLVRPLANVLWSVL